MHGIYLIELAMVGWKRLAWHTFNALYSHNVRYWVSSETVLIFDYGCYKVVAVYFEVAR